MSLFGKKSLKVFVADDFILPENLVVWLKQTKYKPDADTCVWDFLNSALKFNNFGANIFVNHDKVTNYQRIMRADPISLKPDWHGLNIVDNSPNLTQKEAQNFCDEISKDLQDFKIHCPNPNRWYITGDNLSDFKSTPTACVLGEYTHKKQNLPSEWVQILNQIQINLHHHPTNKKRIKNGLPEINSLWCWGVSDNKSIKPKKSKTTIFSDNLEIEIYAQNLRINYQKTDNFMPNNNAILILDKLSQENEQIIELLLNYQKTKEVFYRGVMYY